MFVCMYMRARVCVWLTRTSSFSESNIIVLSTGAFTSMCVCVANTHVSTSSFSESNIIVPDWDAYKCVCVCVCVCVCACVCVCDFYLLISYQY